MNAMQTIERGKQQVDILMDHVLEIVQEIEGRLVLRSELETHMLNAWSMRGSVVVGTVLWRGEQILQYAFDGRDQSLVVKRVVE